MTGDCIVWIKALVNLIPICYMLFVAMLVDFAKHSYSKILLRETYCCSYYMQIIYAIRIW